MPIALAMLAVAAAASWANTLSGTVQVGGIFLDEDGDRSAVQETYNLYDGFVVSRIHLTGVQDSRNSFMLDVRDINLDSRTGRFMYQKPRLLRLTAGYDQSRYAFDPARGVTSDRKDWRFGARYTPGGLLSFTGDVGYVTREGERQAFPAGTMGAAGDRYDNSLLTAQLGMDVRSGRHGGGVSLRASKFSDDLNDVADRTGQVVSARLYAPMPFWNRWNNLLRGSYGVRKLDDGDIEHTLATLRYTSILRPLDAWEIKYAFDAARVEDDALDNRTDRVINDFDASWSHRLGRVNAGYGYEINDDDRLLTSYHSWHAGASVRPDPRVSARVDYAGRVKQDEEELTLLKDVESSRIRAKLEIRPVDALTVGGDFALREREFPDIDVSSEGTVIGAFGRYDLQGWGAVSADYSHSDDEYDNLLAPFETRTHMVTARVETGRVPRLTLAGGMTYLDIRGDLEIEKSIMFVEGAFKLADRYHLNVKYNVYNYDDYILVDRYYTANVLRIDLGYDLRP